MTALDRIAHFLGRRDEVANVQLARDLASRKDQAGIREIAAGLSHKHPGVQADCVKVLYEIGAVAPALVADYVPEFLALLKRRDNRLVWGGMTALSAVARARPDEIYDHRGEILEAMAAGSVITVDAGVLALSTAAASSPLRRRRILPQLIQHLRSCRPKDVPQHAEKILVAVDRTAGSAFLRVLKGRLKELSPSQQARLRKVLRQVEGIQGRHSG